MRIKIPEIPKGKPELEDGDEIVGFKIECGIVVAAVRKSNGHIYTMDWEAALRTLPGRPLKPYYC